MSGLDCWKDLLVEDARKGLRRSHLVSRVEGGKRTAMISYRMSLKLPHDIVVSVIVLVLQNVNSNIWYHTRVLTISNHTADISSS